MRIDVLTLFPAMCRAAFGDSIIKRAQEKGLVRIVLTDIRDFAKVNEVYKEFFNVDPPARTCFEASNLPFNIKCEVEAIIGK